MELQTSDTISQIEQAGSGVAAHDLVRFVQTSKIDRFGGFGFDSVIAAFEVEENAMSVALRVEGSVPRRQKILDKFRNRTSFFLQAIGGLANTKSIPDFKWAELP